MLKQLVTLAAKEFAVSFFLKATEIAVALAFAFAASFAAISVLSRRKYGSTQLSIFFRRIGTDFSSAAAIFSSAFSISTTEVAVIAIAAFAAFAASTATSVTASFDIIQIIFSRSLGDVK